MRKKTHEEYLRELFDREIDHLPLEEYRGYDIPISHECIHGHQTLRSPNNVLRNSECSICCNNKKVSCTDEYLQKLRHKGILYIPVEEYINTDTAILHKCTNNHIWKIAPKHILSERSCPQCSEKTGYYSDSFFRNNPEAGTQPGILYCVVLVNKKTNDRVCIKIGITKGTSNKDALKRVNHFKGYEARIQKLVFGTLKQVYDLEQSLHKQWAHKKYESEWKFGGYSELFELEEEIVKSIPKDFP